MQRLVSAILLVIMTINNLVPMARPRFFADDAQPQAGMTETATVEVVTATVTPELPTQIPVPETAAPTETPENPEATPSAKTAVPAEKETQTATPELPTAQETATGTATATITETASATPTPTDEAVDREAIDLQIEIKPRFLRPGGTIQLGWSLGEYELKGKENLQLRVTLPDGLTPEKSEAAVSKGEGVYDLADTLKNKQGKLKLDTAEALNLEDEAVVRVELIQNGEVVAHAELALPVARRLKAKDGGEVTGLKDKKVKVHFPGGALPEDADVVALDLGEEDGQLLFSPDGKPYLPFKLEAYSLKGEAVTEFGETVTIEYAYDPELFAGNEQILHLEYFDETRQEWKALPGYVDTQAKVIFARTTHFTIFNPSYTDFQAAMLPSMAGWQTAQFTGAATYSIPLELPAGPGGWQPSLALSYNSQVIDNASLYTQASWVGMGWDLSVPYIQRDMRGTYNNIADDIFSISFNGISGTLIKESEDETTGISIWHTEEESFARILRHGFGQEAGSWWEVWMKDGTRYQFGRNQDYGVPDQIVTNRATAMVNICWNPGATEWVRQVPWRWGLSQAINIYGKEIAYFYEPDARKVVNFSCNGPQNVYTDFALYPKEIRYPNQLNRVLFEWEAVRRDYRHEWWLTNYTSTQTAFMDRRLAAVVTQFNSDPNGNPHWYQGGTNMRRYAFGYANDAAAITEENTVIWPGYSWDEADYPDKPLSNQTLTLKHFQELVWGNGTWNALPAYTFNYGTGASNSTNLTSSEAANYPNGDGMHLWWAENGQGGRVEFSYSPWHLNKNETDSQTLAVYDSLQNPNWRGRLAENGEVFGHHDKHMLSTRLHPGAYYEVYYKADTKGYQNTSATLQVMGGYAQTQAVSSVWMSENKFSFYLPGNVSITDPGDSEPYIRLDLDWNNSGSVTGIYDLHYRYIPTFYRVVKMTTKNTYDAANNPEMTVLYSYQGGSMNSAALDGLTPADPYKAEDLRTPFYTSFRGHEFVTATYPDGHQTVTEYLQAYPLMGLSASDKTLDAGGAILAQNFYGYSHSLEGVTQTGEWYRYWTRKIAERNYTAGPEGSNFGRRVEYKYEKADQDNAQYGNLTRVIEQQWNGTQWVSYRQTWTAFHPAVAADRYIVSLPASVTLLKCPGGTCALDSGNTISQTVNYYDGQLSMFGPPSTGSLSAVHTRLRSEGNYNYYSVVSFAYDQWGNAITVRRHANEAYVQTTNWGTSHPAPDSNDQVSTTCFDYQTPGCTYSSGASNGFGVTPMWEKDTYGNATTNYYDASRPWLLAQQVDANQNTSSVFYDEYERLYKVVLPGDSENWPTLQVSYQYYPNSAGWYFWTRASQKVEGTTYRTIQKYYNGLGQMVQTQLENVAVQEASIESAANGCTNDLDGEPDICNIVVKYWSGYELVDGAMHAASRQYLPYAIPGTAAAVFSDSSATIQATSYSDGLGRHFLTKFLNDTTQTTEYSISPSPFGSQYLLQVKTKSPSGEMTGQWQDGLGRTIAVHSYTAQNNLVGPGTRYEYDAGDQLVKVQQIDSANGSVFAETTMSYDLAGRKLTLTDPDMGSWAYSYDSFGNLRRQVDAKGQPTCLTYDRLQRLVRKDYPAAGGACPSEGAATSVSYHYDQISVFANGLWQTIGNPIGRRTSMVSQGVTRAWSYTANGQVQKEFTDLSGMGMGTYEMKYGYNAAGMLTMTRYPDGEVVKATINPWGGSYATLGVYASEGAGTPTQGIITSAQYDVQQRMVVQGYGNGLTLTNLFYKYNIANETQYLGRLKQISVGSLLDLTYEYDADGNISKQTDASTSAKVGETSQQINYTYDALNRLVSSVTTQAGGLPAAATNFTYNPMNGNLATKTINGDFQEYQYGNDAHIHAATRLDSNLYTYDANGNMTSRTEDGVSYTQDWTRENKLKKVSWTRDGIDYETYYLYDGDGTRLIKTEVQVILNNPGDVDNVRTEVSTIYIGGVYEVQKVSPDQQVINFASQASLQPTKAGKGPGHATRVAMEGLPETIPGQKPWKDDDKIDPLASSPEASHAFPGNVVGSHDGNSGDQYNAGGCSVSGWVTDWDIASQSLYYIIETSVNGGAWQQLGDRRLANLYRPDLGGVCGGAGNRCAFNVSIADMAPVNTNFQVRVRGADNNTGGYQLIGGTPKTMRCIDNSAPSNLQFTSTPSIPNNTWTTIRSETLRFVAWNSYTGLSGYYVYYGPDPNGTSPNTFIATAPGDTWRNYTVNAPYNGTFYFRVQAAGRNGNSTPWVTMLIHKYGDGITGWHDGYTGTAYGATTCAAKGWVTDYRLPANATNIQIQTNYSGSWQTIKTDVASLYRGDLTQVCDVRGGACAYDTQLGWHAPVNTNFTVRVQGYGWDGVWRDLSGTYTTLHCSDTTQQPAPYPNWWDIPNNTWTTTQSGTVSINASQTYTGLAGYYVYYGMDPNGTSTNFASKVPWGTVYDRPTSAPDVGVYYLRAAAKGRNGTTSPWVTLFIHAFDNLAPPAPTSAIASNGVQSGVWQNHTAVPSFTIVATNDALAPIWGYDVYWGSDPNGTGTTYIATNSYTAPSAIPNGGTYYLRARSVDAAGNKSAWTTIFTAKYDATPPTLSGGTTTNCGAASGAWQNTCANPTFTLPAASDAASGFSQYLVSWNNQAEVAQAGRSFSPGTIGNGQYYLKVRLKDAAGNISSQTTLFDFRYDGVAPNDLVPGSATAGCSGVVSGQWQNTCADASFAWAAPTGEGGANASPLTGYDVYWETDPLGQTVMYTPNAAAYDPPAVPQPGRYYLRARARDAAGNTSAWVTLYELYYSSAPDAAPPDGLAINIPPAASLAMPVSWQALDGGSGVRGYTVQVKTGAGDWATWLTNTPNRAARFVGAVGQAYTFRVQAVDWAGNQTAWVESGQLAVRQADTVTKYYVFNGAAVAMKTNGELFFLHADHLGSASLVTNGAGTAVSQTRYLPFGEPYWTKGAGLTDKTYTGQRDDGAGLLDYNARMYSPRLGRFVSADTIVPGSMPVNWDRYAYTRNNPLNYIDPSGHREVCDDTDKNCDLKDDDSRKDISIDMPLTSSEGDLPGGKEIKDLYYRWIERFGYLSVNQFFGWMMAFEMNGNQDILFDLDGVEISVLEAMKEVIAKQLFADARSVGGHAPYCYYSGCENGLFNFLADYAQVARKRSAQGTIDKYDYPSGYQTKNPTTMLHDKLLVDSESLTVDVLNAGDEYKVYDDNAPYHWGNQDWAASYGGPEGTTSPNGVVYRNGTFVILTYAQFRNH